MDLLKRIVAKFPPGWQNELKRVYFRHQMRRGAFHPSEPEYDILPSLIFAGDWVIDVGANVGHYTKRFAELVGATGRVIAFEPVLETFALLAANLQVLSLVNVTLVNAALSDRTNLVGMSIPNFDSGLRNFFQARLSSLPDSGLKVLTMSLDSLGIDNRIALVKIDAEGHEDWVLKGMRQILCRDKPILILESVSKEMKENLAAMGYGLQRLEGSPNILFRHREDILP